LVNERLVQPRLMGPVNETKPHDIPEKETPVILAGFGRFGHVVGRLLRANGIPVTILDIEAYKTANPQFNITYLVAPFKNTGLYNQKYSPRKGETSGQVELNYLNNFRTIRFADVLLMAAEAQNRKASPDVPKAQDYLNRVRRRAFGNNSNDITLSGTQLTDAIWEERRLELAMEGDRFFDLVRTGKAASKITGFVAGKHEIFPIPQNEIDISGLTQNPGY